VQADRGCALVPRRDQRPHADRRSVRRRRARNSETSPKYSSRPRRPGDATPVLRGVLGGGSPEYGLMYNRPWASPRGRKRLASTKASRQEVTGVLPRVVRHRGGPPSAGPRLAPGWSRAGRVSGACCVDGRPRAVLFGRVRAGPVCAAGTGARVRATAGRLHVRDPDVRGL
jgi:hypothetical protein